VSALFLSGAFTPELLRNGRIQLRRGRVLAVIVICAAVSLSAVAYFFYSPDAARSEMAALNLVRTMVILQIAVLLIGGGIYCLQSVNREKELNTFDYQRITRLKPIELAIGKLLGAPALAYFIVLCLTPITLIAAFFAQIPVFTLLQICLIVLLGSITYHLLALLLSLLAPPGSSAGTIVLFLFLAGMGSMIAAGMNTFAIHQVSPFFAVELLPSRGEASPFATLPPSQDLFLGVSVPHFLVLVVIYVTFSAFLLLAVTRNIKRDPSVYEIYAPWQGLAFVLYLNALVLGFFRWAVPFQLPPQYRVQFRPIQAGPAALVFLANALWLFAIFGFALLRNRERVRRRIRQYGAMASGWWAAIWPSPYLLAGALATGCAILAMIRYKVEDFGNWNFQVGILEVVFFAIWLVRDFQYLQWMNLQRARRPLVAGVLYLIIFYVCASACMAAFGLYRPFAAPYRAIFIPSAVFGLDAGAWTSAERLWAGALLLLVIETFVFVWLQRRELGKLASPLT
jgi:ABC-2 family transporter protein